MPRSGPPGYVYSLPAVYLAIPGTTITTAQHNEPLQDIADTFNSVQPVVWGGTGASSAAGARSALGLGTMSLQNASGVAITGGTADGVAITGGTVGGTSIGTSTVVLKQSASPTPTAEGDIQWDTDDNQIKIGDGSGTLSFSDNSKLAVLAAQDQVITGGSRVTPLPLGTITTGTVTLDPGDCPLQSYTNGGAHTLAPGSNTGYIFLDITNNASAGAITTPGWTKVVGGFTTTNGNKFRCGCSISTAGSLLTIQAMQ